MDFGRVDLDRPEHLELKVVLADPDSEKSSETEPLVAIPNEMDLGMGGDSVVKREPETDEQEFSRSSETHKLTDPSSVTILTENKILFVEEKTDKKYNKIVDIFKKQSIAEAFKEQVREATQWLKKKKNGTDEADSSLRGEISVETMKFAIGCLHATQNPFHSFLNVLRVKEGNKEKLIAELETIETKTPGFISRDTFREYTAEKKEEKTHLNWWHCCDGDPEEREPTGTLIDYFFAIARAQKVKTNPLVALFPLFGLLLLLIHSQASNTFKERFNFNV